MKKYFFLWLVFIFTWPATAQLPANGLATLLQQPYRTPAQTEQVLYLFRTARDANTVFAAGASLVKILPAPSAENALLNLILQGTDPLKTAFSAVILTSMGSVYEELMPILEETRNAQDPLLRAYGAGAYALVHPEDTTHTADIVRLFTLDEPLAQRAMNLIAQTPRQQLAFLKKAAADTDPQVRAAAATWLGTLHTQAAVNVLLKRVQKETDPSVQTQLAMALAKTPDLALESTAKGLKTPYLKDPAATYALALGFMTGNSVETLRAALASKNQHERINALRAAAYMASVLATPDAFTYSTEHDFDTRLLKGLIAPISALAQHGTPEEQPYAQHTLVQIEKLL